MKTKKKKYTAQSRGGRGVRHVDLVRVTIPLGGFEAPGCCSSPRCRALHLLFSVSSSRSPPCHCSLHPVAVLDLDLVFSASSSSSPPPHHLLHLLVVFPTPASYFPCRCGATFAGVLRVVVVSPVAGFVVRCRIALLVVPYAGIVLLSVLQASSGKPLRWSLCSAGWGSRSLVGFEERGPKEKGHNECCGPLSRRTGVVPSSSSSSLLSPLSLWPLIILSPPSPFLLLGSSIKRVWARPHPFGKGRGGFGRVGSAQTGGLVVEPTSLKRGEGLLTR
jgi:hypothetical protein